MDAVAYIIEIYSDCEGYPARKPCEHLATGTFGAPIFRAQFG